MDKEMFKRIEQITTDTALQPSGHYAQATAWGELIFVSGQLPITPDGRHDAGMPFEEQSNQAVSNLLALLAAANSGPERALPATHMEQL